MRRQPPSGGCVLKRKQHGDALAWAMAAAFGRLCVETVTRAAVSRKRIRSRLRAAVC